MSGGETAKDGRLAEKWHWRKKRSQRIAQKKGQAFEVLSGTDLNSGTQLKKRKEKKKDVVKKGEIVGTARQEKGAPAGQKI